MIKRKYYLYGNVTSEDIEFLYRAKVDFEPGQQEYLEFAGPPWTIAGKKHPMEVITKTDKEDTWLKLYFGDRLRLVEEQFTGYDSYKYNDDYDRF